MGCTLARNTLNSNDTPPFHPPPSSTFVPRVFTRVRYMPRRPFPSPTHQHPHRWEACRGPPGAVARHRHPIPAHPCALAAEESGSRGCFGPWLGWFSHGAMWPFRGDPSVSVFCVGLPEKGTRQCRERGVMPPMPATPQTMTTSLRPSPLFPVCALGVEAGAQHAALLPPPDPTCTHTSGGKLVGTPGHSLPGTAVPFLPDLPPLDVNCFAHSACDSVVPPPPTLSPPARQNSETGGLSNTAPHRCSQLCRRVGCPAW